MRLAEPLCGAWSRFLQFAHLPQLFCGADFAQLALDAATGNLADYVFITPNQCNDMHGQGGCPAPNTTAGDNLLQNAMFQNLMNYALNPDNHAIFIIAWDESGPSPLLPFMYVAPTGRLSSGHDDSTFFTHSSYVRSLQEIFNIDPSHTDPTTSTPYPWLGHAGDNGVSDFSSIFGTNQFP